MSSRYERIRAANPGAAAYDDAVSGARMSDAPGQIPGGQGARYVTILTGANERTMVRDRNADAVAEPANTEALPSAA